MENFKELIEKIQTCTLLQKKQIANRINITPYYLWKLEAGKASPSQKILKNISKQFDIDLGPFNYTMALSLQENILIKKFRKSSPSRRSALLKLLDMI